MKQIDIVSFKRGCGITVEILFIILIISIFTASYSIGIVSGIIIYLIRDFENYMLYLTAKHNNIENIKLK